MNAKIMMRVAAMIVTPLISSAAGAQKALTDDTTQAISTCRLINKPGSYVVTGNITARQQDLQATGPSCILIVADSVTVDLGGFAISGPGTGFGVYATANSSGRYPGGAVVRNGSVRGFDRGIALEGYGHTAQDVRLTNNSGAGLTFDGAGSKGEHVQALWNNIGILCFGAFSHSVRDSEATQNGVDGINLSACPGSSVVGNAVFGNGAGGIIATCPSVVLQNVALQNAAGDIRADAGTCTRSDNSPAP